MMDRKMGRGKEGNSPENPSCLSSLPGWDKNEIFWQVTRRAVWADGGYRFGMGQSGTKQEKTVKKWDEMGRKWSKMEQRWDKTGQTGTPRYN
jgi:hypothetical protein